MPKFGLKLIESINARQKVYQLLIDEVAQLDLFRTDLSNTTYESQLNTLLTYIEYAANGGSLPDTKMKNITKKGDSNAEYEFKSKSLRVYVAQLPSKQVLILGAYKSKKQQRDIDKFRAIKNQYLNILNK